LVYDNLSLCFKQVIEFHSSSNDQVKALKILLHFVQSDSKLYSEFIILDGYKLLTKALISSKIQPSCPMLMVYIFNPIYNIIIEM